ncbi:MAG: DUF4153 domain-containing protein [Tissierellia bacterium]|nr:DUF4153 domain-containing protein [Tissierellia bacterium]
MSRITLIIKRIVTNLKTTISRFPVVLAFLIFIAINVSMLIENTFYTKEQLITRMIIASIFGVFLSIAIQFLIERFENLKKYHIILKILSILLTIIYYLLLTTKNKFSDVMSIRLLICSFALFAIYLYLPTVKNNINFGKVALSHFKSAITAILYAVVIFLGLLAIFFAIDLLLKKLDDKIIPHMANIVFIFFMPMYYLSLLPKFNSLEENDINRFGESASYPKVLEILISNIIIPLILIFSTVLGIYFIKILVTGVWPVGQVGPMVLGYSAVGLFIYILGYNINNRFTINFRKYFPFIWIPLVLMQLFSSWIRIDAYGITESRYFVILFGIFSIICALYLILSKAKNPNMIVLLVACFAILSIIPPVDAFTISRNSQIARIESILTKNDMLVNNEITPKSSISNEDKKEITSISNYLAGMGYLNNLSWMPDEYVDLGEYYNNFNEIYGFEQYYNYHYEDNFDQIFAALDTSLPINVEGFDAFFKFNLYSNLNTNEKRVTSFTLGNNNYEIQQNVDGKGEVVLTILDKNNKSIIEISMKDYFESIYEKSKEPKSILSSNDLTLDIENYKIKIRIIIDNISINKTDKNNVLIDGILYMFVAQP